MADNGLISEVLEKMIDSQIANTQALTALKGTLDENNERLKDIDDFFRNGFRQDINNILSQLRNVAAKEKEDHDRLEVQLESICKVGHDKLEDKLDSIETSVRDVKEQNKLWVKIVAAIVGLGAIAAAILKFLG